MNQPRAIEVLPAHGWDTALACDRVAIDHDARHRRRFRYVTLGGTGFVLDLPRTVVLADGDGLRLSDGRIVAVIAAAEPLIEVTAADPAALLAIAWHIGNRHLPAELRGTSIRLRADHVIAAMLRGLGGSVSSIDAPFNPETGAYAGGHAHHHDDHDHHHHDH